MQNMQQDEGKRAEAEKQGAQGRSLVRKLAEVMAVVHRVPKNGYNSFQNYKYVMEADLSDAVRKELADRGVMVIPELVSHTRNEETFVDTVVMKFTFHDANTDETLSVTMPGTGHDKMDKACFKAITGATKYFLMKTFLIPTGDDPEADTRTDKEADTKAAKEVKQRKLREQSKEVARDEGVKGPTKEVSFDGVVMMDGVEHTSKSGRKYMKVDFCGNHSECEGEGCDKCGGFGLEPKHTALLYQDRYDLLAAIGRAKGKMATAKCEEVTHSKGKFYVITDFEQIPF